MSAEIDTFSDIFKSIFYVVVMIGASNVGKTALVYRYVLNEMPPGLASTVGVEFTKRVVTEKQTGQRIQLHIWDTAGQEKFKSVTKHYYRGTDICILTFDLTNESSFKETLHWIKEIKEYTPEGCLVVLVGNKQDLNNRSVNRDEALQFASHYGFSYYETSALWPRHSPMNRDNISAGIEVIFDKTISQILKNHVSKEELKIIPEKNVLVNMNHFDRKANCEC